VKIFVNQILVVRELDVSLAMIAQDLIDQYVHVHPELEEIH